MYCRSNVPVYYRGGRQHLCSQPNRQLHLFTYSWISDSWKCISWMQCQIRKTSSRLSTSPDSSKIGSDIGTYMDVLYINQCKSWRLSLWFNRWLLCSVAQRWEYCFSFFYYCNYYFHLLLFTYVKTNGARLIDNNCRLLFPQSTFGCWFSLFDIDNEVM